MPTNPYIENMPTNPYTKDMSSMKPNIEDIIKNLPDDALPPEVATALGRIPVQEETVQEPVQAAAQTIGGRKTFKRKGGRKHRRKTHKKNKRRSSKRRQ